MYCLRYWARYVRKGEVKSGGIKIGNESASWILLLDSPFKLQIVLCISFLYINNIQKYNSVSLYVISIIIVFAPIEPLCVTVAKNINSMNLQQNICLQSQTNQSNPTWL